MSCLRIAAAVDVGKALRLVCGKSGEGGCDGCVVGGVAPADAVRLAGIAAREARGDCGGGDVDQQGAVGQQALAAHLVQRKNVGIAQPSRPALIGAARIDEAIADHPFARRQCRADQPFDMIGARGGEQQCLGAWAPALAFEPEQQRADRLGARCAAGLAGQHHR